MVSSQAAVKKAAAAARAVVASQLRQSAYDCWVLSDGAIGVAVRLFKQRNPSWQRTDSARFIRTAAAGVEKRRGFMPGTSHGRPRKLSEEAAQRGLDALWKGYMSEGHQRYFSSFAAACKASAVLRAICTKYKCTERTLLRAMQRCQGGCFRRRLVTKRQLTPDNQLHRVQSCTELRTWSRTRLRHTFWIDAATIWLCPKSRMLYAPPDGDLVCADSRAPANSAQLRKLKFYICINAILGPVALCFITGTTDMEEQLQWTTLAGKPAKGCTNQEWSNVMGTFKEVIEAARKSTTWQAGGGGGSKPIYSFDNDRIHQNVETLSSLKINSHNRFPLPPNSPDMHRVVERCIARLKGAYSSWFYRHPGPRSMAQYRTELKRLFFQEPSIASPEVITEEVDSLPSLFPLIIKAQGGWPPKHAL